MDPEGKSDIHTDRRLTDTRTHRSVGRTLRSRRRTRGRCGHRPPTAAPHPGRAGPGRPATHGGSDRLRGGPSQRPRPDQPVTQHRLLRTRVIPERTNECRFRSNFRFQLYFLFRLCTQPLFPGQPPPRKDAGCGATAGERTPRPPPSASPEPLKEQGFQGPRESAVTGWRLLLGSWARWLGGLGR